MNNLLLPVGRHVGIGIGLFPVPYNPSDPAAKMLFVEAERLFAIPAIIHIDVESHESAALPPNGLRVSCVRPAGGRKEPRGEATYAKCLRVNAILPYLLKRASFTRWLGRSLPRHYLNFFRNPLMSTDW